MNYLAHLLLAEANTASRIGNLLGDFAHGVQLSELPTAVQAGLRRHRAIDRFTDQATEVLSAKTLFSPARRRFAGIALDMLFDHLLIKHWDLYQAQPFCHYKTSLYQQLLQDLPLMPTKMATSVQLLVHQDWFGQYQDLTQLGRALDQIASRIRFNHQFDGVIDEIGQQMPQLEPLFLQFFPRLLQFVSELGPELAEESVPSPDKTC